MLFYHTVAAANNLLLHASKINIDGVLHLDNQNLDEIKHQGLGMMHD